MKHLFIYICLMVGLIVPSTSLGQNINIDENKCVVKEKAMNISGLDISPDGNQLAIVCASNYPLMIYDWRTQEILKEIDIKSDALGYSVSYSSKGNYLLLQEKTLTNNIKKAKLSNFMIIDISQGKVMEQYRKIADLKIAADESHYYLLDKAELSVYDLKSGQKVKSFEIENARNAIAVSPDGNDLAIVVEPTKEELVLVPSIRNDKKALKNAMKYRHMIAIYDIGTEKFKKIVPEIYDNINTMQYSKDGNKLLNFNAAANSYINVIDATDYSPLREAYMSRTNVQPDFSFNPDGSLFGIASVERFPTVNIYQAGKGSMVDHYDTENRIWKSMKQKMYPGTYSSFVFLPEGNYVIIAYGNALIKWKIEGK